MQGVGLPPLHIEVQEPKGVYFVQDEVEASHGENRLSRIDLLLLIRILPIISSFPPIRFLTNPSHRPIWTVSLPPCPYHQSRKILSPLPPSFLALLCGHTLLLLLQPSPVHAMVRLPFRRG